MKGEVKNYSCRDCSKFVAFTSLVLHKGKPYHLDCFICACCSSRLHLMEEPFSKRGKLYCSKCSKNLGKPFILRVRTFWQKNTNRSVGRCSDHKEESFVRLRLNSCTSEFEDDSFTTDKEVTLFENREIDFEELRERLDRINKYFPGNVTTKVFNEDFFEEFKQKEEAIQRRILQCISASLTSPHQLVLPIAIHSSDYDELDCFFLPWIKAWNRMLSQAKLQSYQNVRWKYSEPFCKEYELNGREYVNHGDIKGIQFRFIRNLEDFAFIGNMSLKERARLESHLLPVLKRLIKSKYKGRIVKIMSEFDALLTEPESTPEVRIIHFEEYQQLKKKLDPFSIERKQNKLSSAFSGSLVERYFPKSSGVYISADDNFRIFYNHEDHLVVEYFTHKQSTQLKKNFSKIVCFMSVFEECYRKEYHKDMNFKISPRFGFMTSSPAQLGSAFVPAVFLKLPELADQDGLSGLAQRLNINFKQRYISETKKSAFFKVQVKPKIFYTEEMAISNLFNIIPRVLKEEAYADAI